MVTCEIQTSKSIFQPFTHLSKVSHLNGVCLFFIVIKYNKLWRHMDISLHILIQQYTVFHLFLASGSHLLGSISGVNHLKLNLITKNQFVSLFILKVKTEYPTK